MKKRLEDGADPKDSVILFWANTRPVDNFQYLERFGLCTVLVLPRGRENDGTDPLDPCGITCQPNVRLAQSGDYLKRPIVMVTE